MPLAAVALMMDAMVVHNNEGFAIIMYYVESIGSIFFADRPLDTVLKHNIMHRADASKSITKLLASTSLCAR